MASLPMVPGMREAMRLALVDLYQHSIRLVPVNLAWGLGLIVVIGLGMAGAVWLAILVVPLLALPLVALARLAGEIVRGEEVVLSDAWRVIGELGVRAMVACALVVGVVLVLGSNVLLGLAEGTAPAMAIAVAAGWGLVAIGLVALPFWLLLADPSRHGRGLAAALRECAALLLVEPSRLIVLAAVVSAVLVVGTLLVAAILTVGVAYAVLVTARVVLPAADRLAGSQGLAPTD
jgi:hypothetical protein